MPDPKPALAAKCALILTYFYKDWYWFFHQEAMSESEQLKLAGLKTIPKLQGHHPTKAYFSVLQRPRAPMAPALQGSPPGSDSGLQVACTV